jgi:gamma-glutamyltranspeptidase/glutathione hydrolase
MVRLFPATRTGEPRAGAWVTSPRRPPAVGLRGMVATSQPLAALAGVRALDAGGNAVDAALAAAGVLAVTEPNQCGVGGDLFALIVRDGAPAIGLNAAGHAPRRPGAALPEQFGQRSVTVPGCVAGWADLARAHSRLGLERALAPAIDLAESGFALPPKARRLWEEARGDLAPEAAAAFDPAPPVRNTALAGALRAAADGTFYTGPVAETIASVSWLDRDDLAAHTNDWVEPLRFPYAGHALLELPPPGQGSIAGWALESLARPDVPDQVEALAAAYARGYATIGGTSYVCAADGDGTAVSLIQSVFWGFGSRVLVPGGGFVLQNRAHGFVSEPGHPNAFAPGKRPFHTIIPAALEDDRGRWTAVLGVTGGEFQPQGHVQVVCNLLDRGMDPQAALDAPRFRLEADGSVSLEPPLAALVDALDRPARVVDDADEYGNGHVIARDDDGLLIGGSEPRRDGLALGY